MARVGLLEDNMRIARLCTTMLQYAGHRVTVYSHARECLNMLLLSLPSDDPPALEALPPLPIDVLVLDLYLPDIDGLEVLRILHNHPRTRTLPLLLCTAATPAEIAQARKIMPHVGIIEKPFTFKQLISAITTALNSPVK